MASTMEDDAVKLFDQLVSEGVIIYGPHQAIFHEDNGFPVSMLIRIDAMIKSLIICHL
jgi:hypothetical protein